MGRYFEEIIHGVKSAFEGMSITFASMLIKPVTVQYPDVDVRSDEQMRADGYDGPLRGMPENYRGILNVNLDICISCGLCQKACPIDCIIIEDVKADKRKVQGTKSDKESTKTKEPIRFDIDMGKCMFCGLCSDPCPTGAIYHTNEFHFNQPTLDDLVFRFVKEEDAEKYQKRAAEIAVEEAEKKKAKKEAEAKAKAEAETAEKPEEAK